jgi:uncharacterized protein
LLFVIVPFGCDIVTLFNIALLFFAGLAGGIANAIAGGATLITFPAMIAVGLPPLIANASNAVAVTPGQLIAAITDRANLPKWSRLLLAQIVIATLGGVLGAILLLITTQHVFMLLVPALIGLATLLYAFSRQVQAFIAKRFKGEHAENANIVLLFGTTVYGGYFGAGQGIMLLAVLSLVPSAGARETNALKNLLSSFVSAATLVIFVAQNMVQWPQTLVMLCGAICGGFAGAKLLRVIPLSVVRRVVIVIGSVVTLVYVWRYWI